MIASSRYKRLFAVESGALQHLLLAGDTTFYAQILRHFPVKDRPTLSFDN
jgi:hypothetical protein